MVLKRARQPESPRAASPTLARSGAGCGGCSPRAGGFGLPGSSQPLPSLPLRQPGRDRGTARGESVLAPRSSLSREPSPILHSSPCKNFHLGKLFAGCLRGAGEGTRLGGERGSHGTLWGSWIWGGWQEKRSTGRAAARLQTRPRAARSRRAETRKYSPKRGSERGGSPRHRGGTFGLNEGRSREKSCDRDGKQPRLPPRRFVFASYVLPPPRIPSASLLLPQIERSEGGGEETRVPASPQAGRARAGWGRFWVGVVTPTALGSSPAPVMGQPRPR